MSSLRQLCIRLTGNGCILLQDALLALTLAVAAGCAMAAHLLHCLNAVSAVDCIYAERSAKSLHPALLLLMVTSYRQSMLRLKLNVHGGQHESNDNMNQAMLYPTAG